tara:strand:- start:59 stop:613 length:555 start_codon:yes stop_codon:yes gene_type:complete
MDKKRLIREKYFIKRKRFFFEIKKSYFKPLISIIKKKNYQRKTNISLYYPSNFEVNIFKILDIDFFKNFNFSLPIIKKKQEMYFCRWKKGDILQINKFGIPEPKIFKKIIPEVVLVPLLAFDKNKNRIGYGGGYYDKFLKTYLKKHKKLLTVGIAFSFQKHHNLPVDKSDFKLDHILTEKGIIL